MPALYHMGRLVNARGDVSALCYTRPRAIRRAQWTNRPAAVTCGRCRALLTAAQVARSADAITRLEAERVRRGVCRHCGGAVPCWSPSGDWAVGLRYPAPRLRISAPGVRRARKGGAR